MNKLITTPIFYASGEPHLGHVYSIVIADTLKRYYQLKGTKAFLITGTDENGQKIEQKARRTGTDPKQFVEKNATIFRELWDGINLKPDCFVRTTSQKHHQLVTAIWKKLRKSGDIYKGSYTGLYCVDCEQFYSEHQLNDRACPVHDTPVEYFSETSYLFRLSEYRDRLLNFLTSNENFIQPASYQQNIIRFLNQPDLKDLSVSRTNFHWGIPVPEDNSHLIYVWLDALFSYITAIKDLACSEKDLSQTIHIIGKDILQFHAVYWLAFLSAADQPFPKAIHVHGWWTLEGKKISKSNPSNLIKPAALANLFSCDGLRFGLLSRKPLDRDGDFVLQELIEIINTSLANKLGNLVKRTVTLIHSRFAGKLAAQSYKNLTSESREILSKVNHSLIAVDEAYSNCRLYEVCVTLSHLVSEGNRFFDKRTPWNCSSDEDRNKAQETLLVTGNLLIAVSTVFSPIIPELSAKILVQFGKHGPCRWPNELKLTNLQVEKPSTVFARKLT